MFGLHFGGFVGYSGWANKPQVSSLIFWSHWVGQITVRELHGQFELATLPNGLLLSRYTALPVLEVQDALTVARWSRIESKRVIAPPELSVQLSCQRACTCTLCAEAVHGTYRSSWRRFIHKDMSAIG